MTTRRWIPGDGPRFSYRHVLEASSHRLSDLAAKEEAIARDVFRHGRQLDNEEASAQNVFLTPEQFAERKRLQAIAHKRAKARLKAIRRAAEGKPYGQGAHTRVIPEGDREPLEGVSRWRTVDRPKPHGPRPKGYVLKSPTTGKDRR